MSLSGSLAVVCATKPHAKPAISTWGCRRLRAAADGVVMRKTWAVMRRDLLKRRRNPLTMMVSILLPIIYLVIFGNSFQGVLKHLPVVIVSQDSGPFGVRVMEQMQALAAGPKTVSITYAHAAAWALDEVRNGRYKAALIIPAGFSRDITQGRIGEL